MDTFRAHQIYEYIVRTDKGTKMSMVGTAMVVQVVVLFQQNTSDDDEDDTEGIHRGIHRTAILGI